MRTEQIALSPLAPGADLSLTVQRFGREGARPRIYVQASLHADEIPGMIAAHHLRERLTALEAEGKIKGEIILVPSANPIGLAQRVMGDPIGRFNLADGTNFRRVRLGLEGKAFRVFDYNFLYEFGGSGVEEGGRIVSAWAQYSALPVKLRVGAFQPTTGLEDAAKRSREIFVLLEGAMALILIHGDTAYAAAAAEAARRLVCSSAAVRLPAGVAGEELEAGSLAPAT